MDASIEAFLLASLERDAILLARPHLTGPHMVCRDSAVVMCTCQPLMPLCCKSGYAQVANDSHSHRVIEPAAASRDNAEDLGRKAARRRTILAEIARRFCDPAFDLTDAARKLGLSRRYVQRLLEGTG